MTGNTLTFTARRALVAGSLLGLTLLPGIAAAQQGADDTEIRATLYAFVPALEATTRFPTPLGSTIDIDAETLVDNTEFALMAAFEFQKRRWGGFVDILYYDIGGTKAGTRELAVDGVPLPVNLTADAALDVTAAFVTMAANFRAVSTPSLILDVFGGARRLDVETTLAYRFNTSIGPQPGPAGEGVTSVAKTAWDGVGGVKGRIALTSNRRLYLLYYGDLGAGDSDLTWQGLAGMGLAFKHVDLLGTWRYLDYELADDSRLDNLNLSGPAVGVSFHW
jgi:hypothetical protein